jgi:hypothetical protein
LDAFAPVVEEFNHGIREIRGPISPQDFSTGRYRKWTILPLSSA